MRNVINSSIVNYDKKLKSLIVDAESLARGLRDLQKAKRQYIGAWCVVHTGGFFRAVRRIDGKVSTIHLGKAFNPDMALQKIQSWESENGVAPTIPPNPANLSDHGKDTT